MFHIWFFLIVKKIIYTICNVSTAYTSGSVAVEIRYVTFLVINSLRVLHCFHTLTKLALIKVCTAFKMSKWNIYKKWSNHLTVYLSRHIDLFVMNELKFQICPSIFIMVTDPLLLLFVYVEKGACSRLGVWNFMMEDFTGINFAFLNWLYCFWAIDTADQKYQCFEIMKHWRSCMKMKWEIIGRIQGGGFFFTKLITLQFCSPFLTVIFGIFYASCIML